MSLGEGGGLWGGGVGEMVGEGRQVLTRADHSVKVYSQPSASDESVFITIHYVSFSD